MTTESLAIPPELREKYLTQVVTRRTELAQFLAHFEKSQASQGDLAATRIHAHSLKGTGATYGYPDISATGRALEEAIDRNADQLSIASLIRGVLASCDHAVGSRKIDVPRREDTVSAAIADTPITAKPTVLVVDDDPAILEMLKQLLSEDARMFTAIDGNEALAIIEREKPDLVVLDDKMPGMTGMELMERWQASGIQLPSQIIMLTANSNTPDIIRGMSAGAVDYITKPFEAKKLLDRIRGLLRCLQTTILVADDDAAVRGLLQHKFRVLGFRLLYAEDGEQTIKMMRESKPQLAIIDRMMPGLDGLAVLQMMRQEDGLRDIPVILLTAKRQNQDVVEGFDLGATDYIVKPFMPDEVVARAMRLLGINRASRS